MTLLFAYFAIFGVKKGKITIPYIMTWISYLNHTLHFIKASLLSFFAYHAKKDLQ